MTSSIGAINATTLWPTGTIRVNGSIISNNNVTLTSGYNGSITISAGSAVIATNNDVNLNAPLQNINGVAMALNGNVNLQSNALDNSLTVNFGPQVGNITAALIANSPGSNVTFNNTTAGNILITGGPLNGLIYAGNDVILNSGSGQVVSLEQQIIGCIHVTGSYFNIQSWVGNLDFCNGISTTSANGSGGTIIVAANGGSVNSGSITANGNGAGNTGGTINISGSNGVNLGTVNADGTNGAVGGSITITAPGQTIAGTYLSATGSGSTNGGSITTNSGTLTLSGADSSGNSVDVNGGNNGGSISITTTSPQSFVVGNGSSTGNGTAGNISANGTNGGFITLSNSGSPNLTVNGEITANGTSGSGGGILIQEQPASSSTLTVQFNGGLIQASNNANNSGKVGFNGGAGQNINLLGFGAVSGGQGVYFGNLNPDASNIGLLAQSGGFITISPFITVTNSIFGNGTFLPLSSTTNTSTSTGGININGTRSTGVTSVGSTGTTNNNSLVYNLSKTATDYTPWGHFYYWNFQQRPVYQLGVAFKRRTTAYVPGSISYSHSFTNAELNRLTDEGMHLVNTNQNNYLKIAKGNILVSPDKKIIVGTQEGDITMAPGVIAFVMENGHDVTIYPLRATAPNQISVMLKNHKLSLQPGQMLVLTRQNVKDFEDIDADCHMVNYRAARELPIKETGVKAFVAEYSIASAFNAIEPLNQLIASTDNQDKAVFNKILLSAATLGNFANSLDKQQLANLQRQLKEAEPENTDEKIIDSAKQMAVGQGRPVQ